MKQTFLTLDEILHGYDIVSKLYPHIPSMNIWRAWEYAAYKRFKLPEPLLDIGCGDGAFLKLIWPNLKNVTGIDISPQVVELAKHSGVYSQVHLCAADKLSVPQGSFAGAFANCSLEHMDNLPTILKNVYNSLAPGGVFLLSIVTEKFIEWSTLPLILQGMGEEKLSEKLLKKHIEYHHLVNPLSIPQWQQEFETAGFTMAECIPIVPEMTSKLFLFTDTVWHIEQPDGEMGNAISAYFSKIPNFPALFRQIFQSVIQMETQPAVTSGAVFLAKKN